MYTSFVATVTFRGYEWDSEKAAFNVEKHGVSFEQATYAIEDTNAIETADLVDPSRIVTIGMNPETGILVVVSTDVEDDLIRIISARPANARETGVYRNP
jgi:uncharacterized DUF497 family protein